MPSAVGMFSSLIQTRRPAVQMIRTWCEHCSTQLSVPESAAGQKVRCPKCKKIFLVFVPEPNDFGHHESGVDEGKTEWSLEDPWGSFTPSIAPATESMKLPVVHDYEISKGRDSESIDWHSTLTLSCPSCRTELKLKYQPAPSIDCPNCGTVFRISHAKLAAAIRQQAKTISPQQVKSFQPYKPSREFLQVMGCLSVPIAVIVGLTVAGLIFRAFSANGPKESRQSGANAIVYNSYLDGSVYQVESWLRQNLKDPESLEVIEWFKVVERKDGSFSVVVEYRARNGFGGFNVEKMKFYLDSKGNITDQSDY